MPQNVERMSDAFPDRQDAASPSAATPPELTELLHAWRDGDEAAFGKVIVHVQAELRRMAMSRLHGEGTPSLATDDLL